MDYKVILYIAYTAIAIGLTVWVARTLFKNGKIFLIDIFSGQQDLANSVNKLLLTGFYLINFGYTVFALKTTSTVLSAQEMIEVLSVKLGLIILVLGFMHFFNLFVFFRLRKKARDSQEDARIRADYEASKKAWAQNQPQ